MHELTCSGNARVHNCESFKTRKGSFPRVYKGLSESLWEKNGAKRYLYFVYFLWTFRRSYVCMDFKMFTIKQIYLLILFSRTFLKYPHVLGPEASDPQKEAGALTVNFQSPQGPSGSHCYGSRALGNPAWDLLLSSSGVPLAVCINDICNNTLWLLNIALKCGKIQF